MGASKQIKHCELECGLHVSRLLVALSKIGFTWKNGSVGPKSQFNQTYGRWANGESREGHDTPLFKSPDECADRALRMFRELWVSKERVII